MKPNDALTFCTVSCGNNFHIECVLRWIQHKRSQSQTITCPVKFPNYNAF